MTEISAALVKELRERTGAGMMDCKRALQETNGDMDAAIVLLREKGMASAQKRADRATTEGLVGYRLADDDTKGTMVAVGCETEPVSKNDEFQAFAKKVLDTVDDGRRRRGRVSSTQSARSSRRSSARTSPWPVPRGSRRSTARSSPRTRIRRRTSSASCCSFAAATPISAGSSRCTSPRRIRSGSAATTCRRKRSPPSAQIYENSDEVQSKPEQAREKIVEGMLNKRFFGANVLTDQEWIHDSVEDGRAGARRSRAPRCSSSSASRSRR